MSTNNNYKINNVEVSTNGQNEIYFDIDWQGDDYLDYYELRVYEEGEECCLEICAYPAHQQRVVVKDFYFINRWESKQVNTQKIVVELGIYNYNSEGELISKEILAQYQPVELNIYYKHHLFRKNVIELR